jgi:hypothetical protein
MRFPRPFHLALLVAGLTVSAVVVRFGGSFVATQALLDAATPKVLKMMPLPKDCIVADEPPPPGLMRMVEFQRGFYRLTLQKVVVCRTPRQLPQSEPDFTNVAFGEETRRRWLPVYVGCCTYEFRRHFAVVVADVNDQGSLVVEAALVQNRWEYFKHNWNKKQPAWSYW